MPEPQTSATWDGQPLPPTCGCGGHCTAAVRCQCGACPNLGHSSVCPVAHPEPASVRDLHDERQGGGSGA